MIGISALNQVRDFAAKALFEAGVSRALLRKREPQPIVLLYHNPDPGIFAEHLAFLGKRFAFVPAPGISPGNAPLTQAAVSFTFDDGYRGVHTEISPLLKQAGAPATMFIPTAFLGKRFAYEALKLALQKTPLTSAVLRAEPFELHRPAQRKDAWHRLVAGLKQLSSDERDQEIDRLIEALKVQPADIRAADIISSDELRVMAEQLEIGSHTVSHPNLSLLSRAAAHRELSDSKRELEAITGKSCRLFAYPIGRRDDYTAETVEVLSSVGYSKAFSAVPTTDVHSAFEYPRLGVGDRDSVETLCLKLTTVWPALFRMLV